jgi:hypothetical protein
MEELTTQLFLEDFSKGQTFSGLPRKSLSETFSSFAAHSRAISILFTMMMNTAKPRAMAGRS